MRKNVQKKFNFYECIPDWIGVKTNINGFRWGFGKCDVPVDEVKFNRCKLKVVLEVTKDSTVFKGVEANRFSNCFRHFKAAAQSGALLYDQMLARVFPLRYLMTVSDDTIYVVVGKTYLKFVKAKMMYIHSMPYILFDVITMLLLKHGMTTLYCSAVRLKDGRTIVFLAPPNTGKSLTALKLHRDFGADIIAEDMAVTDGERIWGAPHTGLYRNYHDKSLRSFTSERSSCTSGKVDAVAILQKGGNAHGCELNDCINKLALLNRYSLGYYYSPCVRVIDYYNDAYSTQEAQNTEMKILERLQSGSKVFLIEDADPMQFSQQICNLLGELEHENEVQPN